MPANGNRGGGEGIVGREDKVRRDADVVEGRSRDDEILQPTTDGPHSNLGCTSGRQTKPGSAVAALPFQGGRRGKIYRGPVKHCYQIHKLLVQQMMRGEARLDQYNRNNANQRG